MPLAETPDSVPLREADAVAVATGFATAWARPDLSPERWGAEIAPWCTPRFGAQLRGLSPAGTPARRVTGQPKLTHQEPGTLTYSVPLDAGNLTVTVIAIEGQWKVSKREFGSETAAGAPFIKPTQ